jgi:hypothetical protein
MGTEMSLPFWYSRAPRTDDEVYEQIAAQYHDPIFSAVLRGLYLVNRLEGQDVLVAWKNALLVSIGRKEKS